MKQINNGKKNYLGSRYASRAPVQLLLLLLLPVLVVVVAVGLVLRWHHWRGCVRKPTSHNDSLVVVVVVGVVGGK